MVQGDDVTGDKTGEAVQSEITKEVAVNDETSDSKIGKADSIVINDEKPVESPGVSAETSDSTENADSTVTTDSSGTSDSAGTSDNSETADGEETSDNKSTGSEGRTTDEMLADYDYFDDRTLATDFWIAEFEPGMMANV